MVSTELLSGNWLFRGQLKTDAKQSNFDHFGSVVNIKSLRMPLFLVVLSVTLGDSETCRRGKTSTWRWKLSNADPSSPSGYAPCQPEGELKSAARGWLMRTFFFVCFLFFGFVLFCFVLFCFVLFCFVLFCFVLFCFVVFVFVFVFVCLFVF